MLVSVERGLHVGPLKTEGPGSGEGGEVNVSDHGSNGEARDGFLEVEGGES